MKNWIKSTLVLTVALFGFAGLASAQNDTKQSTAKVLANVIDAINFSSVRDLNFGTVLRNTSPEVLPSDANSAQFVIEKSAGVGMKLTIAVANQLSSSNGSNLGIEMSDQKYATYKLGKNGTPTNFNVYYIDAQFTNDEIITINLGGKLSNITSPVGKYEGTITLTAVYTSI